VPAGGHVRGVSGVAAWVDREHVVVDVVEAVQQAGSDEAIVALLQMCELDPEDVTAAVRAGNLPENITAAFRGGRLRELVAIPEAVPNPDSQVGRAARLVDTIQEWKRAGRQRISVAELAALVEGE
jgi:hypothetical protein